MQFSKYSFIPFVFLCLFFVNIWSSQKYFTKVQTRIEKEESHGADTLELRKRNNDKQMATIILLSSYFMFFFFSFGLAFIFQGESQKDKQVKDWWWQVYCAVWLFSTLLFLQGIYLSIIPPILNDTFDITICTLFIFKGLFLIPSYIYRKTYASKKQIPLLPLFVTIECIIALPVIFLILAFTFFDNGSPWFG